MTRHHAVASAPELGLAAKAAATIADQQVRNRGTIGGSLAHGDPASDLPAVLLALEGTVVARGEGGEREIAAADLFQDYLTTALARARSSPRCGSRPARAGAPATPSSTGASRTGRWWRSARRCARRPTGPARTCASA